MKFKNKSAAKEHFKKMLNRYPIGQTITKRQDKEDICELINRHPRAAGKMANGPLRFYVDTNSYGKRCFFIEDSKGNKIDFSYIKCIDGEKSDFGNFTAACRTAVAKDARSLKKRYFKANADYKGRVKCGVTGRPISYTESHLDHCGPYFKDIVKGFIKNEKIDISHVSYNRDGISGIEFHDDILAQKFRCYHLVNSNFRVIEAKENLKRSHLARL